MNRLSGKTAVVTGASKGIGAGIAKGLAAEGAAVVVNYASSKDGADRVVADIKAKGGKAIAVQGDVAKAADVKKADLLLLGHGHVDHMSDAELENVQQEFARLRDKYAPLIDADLTHVERELASRKQRR